MIKSINIVSSLAIAFCGNLHLQAVAVEDWGYDNIDPPPVGLSAGQARSLCTTSHPGEAQAIKPSEATAALSRRQVSELTRGANEGRSERSAYKSSVADQSVRDWLKLYSLAGGHDLVADEKKLAQEELQARLGSPQRAEVLGVLEFWPRLESAFAANQEQKENYRSLLRALLRIEAARVLQSNQKESEFISSLLGPIRIAAAGTPPLTEDAVEAYADMACFLYEQSHPGKTVNALDNRMVFASVIRGKFIEAPEGRDRYAMANFDLSWSKFRILWASADEHGRQKILSAWTHWNATAGGAKLTDPTLDLVLHKGPWSDAQPNAVGAKASYVGRLDATSGGKRVEQALSADTSRER